MKTGIVITFTTMKIGKLIMFLIVALLMQMEARTQSVASWKATDVADYIAKDDSVLVMSFWATFCKPCVEEIPYLQSITEKYKGQRAKLFLVSLDLPEFFPAKIEAYAKSKDFYVPMAWLNETNADYFCPKIDKGWDGSIPCTLIVNNKKGYRHFIDHQMKPEEFEGELRKEL